MVMKLNWRPHTEVPDQKDENKACLIAEQDYDGDWCIIEGLFYFTSLGKPHCWLREDDWEEYKPDSRFLWLPESELLATLPNVNK
jgi:hypothetical protein